jgi:hypothetical protein
MNTFDSGPLLEILKKQADPEWFRRELEQTRARLNAHPGGEEEEDARAWLANLEIGSRLTPRQRVIDILVNVLVHAEEDIRLPAQQLPRLLTHCNDEAAAEEAQAAAFLSDLRKPPEVITTPAAELEEEARACRYEVHLYQTVGTFLMRAINLAADWLPKVPGMDKSALQEFARRQRRRAGKMTERIARIRERLKQREEEVAMHLRLAEQADEAAGKMEDR